MFLLKLGSELTNLFKSIQSALKIWLKCRVNYHKMECTGSNFTNHCYFSLNNSETVIAVGLAFCSIQKHFIGDIRDNFDIPNLPQSPYIGQNSDGTISDFQISGQAFIEENCHNSRTSNDIDVKLELVTKLEKKTRQYQKTLMMALYRNFWRHCHFSDLLPIWSNAEVSARTYSL